MPLQNPQRAKRKMRRMKVKRTFLPSSKTNIGFLATRGSGAGIGGRFAEVAMILIPTIALEYYSHLRANYDCIGNVARAAGIDNILDIGLDITPGCKLKSMRE